MNKYRIVIASVLKPVTEPRAFAKLAVSMRETSKYHINIIGFCSKNPVKEDGIQFTPVFCRKRTHLFRLFVPFKFLKEVMAYRPHVVIVTTYELLPLAIVAKALLKFKLIYDLQENYSQNVLLNRNGSPMLRHLMAFLIRGIEKVVYRFIDHYFFAEEGYRQQFPHIAQYTVLENKYAGPPEPLSLPISAERPLFIISGTITPVYGIEKAIHWFLSLRKKFPQARLHIVGHVPLEDFRIRVYELTSGQQGISLNISPKPIHYAAVLDAIRQADVVLMPYDDLDSIRYKMPSKLYESVALHKPILISKNPIWEKFLQKYSAGLAVDFSKIEDAAADFQSLLDLNLYKKSPGDEALWKSEKPKLLRILQQLLP